VCVRAALVFLERSDGLMEVMGKRLESWAGAYIIIIIIIIY